MDQKPAIQVTYRRDLKVSRRSRGQARPRKCPRKRKARKIKQTYDAIDGIRVNGEVDLLAFIYAFLS